MASHKTAELAKHDAVSRAFGFIFGAFVLALIIALGLPRLLALVLNSSTPDSTKTMVTVIIGLITSLFFMWFSRDRVKTDVELAINTAEQVRIKDYEAKNPGILDIRRRREVEYCCAIPLLQRSQESIEAVAPISDLCRRREGRDAVLRGLAYNDDLLDIISTKAVNDTLIELKKDNSITSSDYNIFRNDVYAYLKAWLMTSIAYDYVMPVTYIKQRLSPKSVYIRAVKNIKRRAEFVVFSNLEEKYRQQAISVFNEYLDKLIEELENMAK